MTLTFTPPPPVTEDNLVLVLRLKRLGLSSEYIFDFVTGPHTTTSLQGESYSTSLILPLKVEVYKDSNTNSIT